MPHFEWLVYRRIPEALWPGCKEHNDFAVQMGHDAVIVDPIFRKERISENRWLDVMGQLPISMAWGASHNSKEPPPNTSWGMPWAACGN